MGATCVKDHILESSQHPSIIPFKSGKSYTSYKDQTLSTEDLVTLIKYRYLPPNVCVKFLSATSCPGLKYSTTRTESQAEQDLGTATGGAGAGIRAVRRQQVSTAEPAMGLSCRTTLEHSPGIEGVPAMESRG